MPFERQDLIIIKFERDNSAWTNISFLLLSELIRMMENMQYWYEDIFFAKIKIDFLSCSNFL